MPSSPQPRAAFAVTVTETDYLVAARVVSRLTGRLHTLRQAIMFGMAAVLLLTVLTRGQPLVAVGILLVGLLLIGLAAWSVRRAVDAAARRDYAVFAALLSPATVTLWEDSLEVAGAHFTRRDPYALLTRLADTPSLFVAVREDGSFVVLPKHDIPVDGGRVADFLRGTFANKVRRMR